MPSLQLSSVTSAGINRRLSQPNINLARPSSPGNDLAGMDSLEMEFGEFGEFFGDSLQATTGHNHSGQFLGAEVAGGAENGLNSYGLPGLEANEAQLREALTSSWHHSAGGGGQLLSSIGLQSCQQQRGLDSPRVRPPGVTMHGDSGEKPLLLSSSWAGNAGASQLQGFGSESGSAGPGRRVSVEDAPQLLHSLTSQQQHQQLQLRQGNRAGAVGAVEALSGDPQQLFSSIQETSEARSLAQLKSHSEAERRRRERINHHLATLREMLPSAGKDKASVLAEVIDKVKELAQQVSQMQEAGPVPGNVTELTVVQEGAEEDGGEGSNRLRATLCCEDRPDLLMALIRSLQALKLQMVRAEMVSLGTRVKHVLLLAQEAAEEEDNGGGRVELPSAETVEAALKAVVDPGRGRSMGDHPSSWGSSGKRQRLSAIESNSSPSDS